MKTTKKSYSFVPVSSLYAYRNSDIFKFPISSDFRERYNSLTNNRDCFDYFWEKYHFLKEKSIWCPELDRLSPAKLSPYIVWLLKNYCLGTEADDVVQQAISLHTIGYDKCTQIGWWNLQKRAEHYTRGYFEGGNLHTKPQAQAAAYAVQQACFILSNPGLPQNLRNTVDTDYELRWLCSYVVNCFTGKSSYEDKDTWYQITEPLYQYLINGEYTGINS